MKSSPEHEIIGQEGIFVSPRSVALCSVIFRSGAPPGLRRGFFFFATRGWGRVRPIPGKWSGAAGRLRTTTAPVTLWRLTEIAQHNWDENLAMFSSGHLRSLPRYGPFFTHVLRGGDGTEPRSFRHFIGRYCQARAFLGSTARIRSHSSGRSLDCRLTALIICSVRSDTSVG